LGGLYHHWKIALENRDGAKSEFRAGRYSNVGLLAIRSLEQAIEACASKEGFHFHDNPRTAHRMRREWLRTKFPELVEKWDILWSIYGVLGYGGVNGERAREAIRVLDETLEVLRRTCIEAI